MSDPISRRIFNGLARASCSARPPARPRPTTSRPSPPVPRPVEAAFERDYPAPGFKPSWKKPQINRLLVQDFVIFAHSDLEMTKKLLDKEPALLNAVMDWGAGDWETGLGGASHMGRRDIVEFLLERGARIDIFCAAMMGQLDAVKSFLDAAAEADRRQGAARLHAPLPRPGRREGVGERPRLSPVGQEDRAEAEPVPEEGRRAGEVTGEAGDSQAREFTNEPVLVLSDDADFRRDDGGGGGRGPRRSRSHPRWTASRSRWRSGSTRWTSPG